MYIIQVIIHRKKNKLNNFLRKFSIKNKANALYFFIQKCSRGTITLAIGIVERPFPVEP